MNLNEAILILEKWQKFCKKEAGGEYIEKSLVVSAFQIFWRSKPTKEQFINLTRGTTILPEVVYIMSTEKF